MSNFISTPVLTPNTETATQKDASFREIALSNGETVKVNVKSPVMHLPVDLHYEFLTAVAKIRNLVNRWNELRLDAGNNILFSYNEISASFSKQEYKEVIAEILPLRSDEELDNLAQDAYDSEAYLDSFNENEFEMRKDSLRPDEYTKGTDEYNKVYKVVHGQYLSIGDQFVEIGVNPKYATELRGLKVLLLMSLTSVLETGQATVADFRRGENWLLTSVNDVRLFIDTLPNLDELTFYLDSVDFVRSIVNNWEHYDESGLRQFMSNLFECALSEQVQADIEKATAFLATNHKTVIPTSYY